MYTIYISHNNNKDLLEEIKKSRINYAHNIVYINENSYLRTKELISESQFLVADITDINIDVGITIGIALEQSIRVITIQDIKSEKENIKLDIPNKDIIKYGNSEDLINKLEKAINDIY